MSEPEPPLAAFLYRGGVSRSVCLGCSEILHEQGMVAVIQKNPMPVRNAPDGTYCAIVYQIVPPFTLAECQDAIKGRHVGPAWGE